MRLRTRLLIPLAALLFLLLPVACDSNTPAPTATIAAQPGTTNTPPASLTPSNRIEVSPTAEASTATQVAAPQGDTPTAQSAESSTLPPTATAENQPPTATSGIAATIPSPSGTVVDAIAGTAPPTPADNAPSPTAVAATSSGDAITAMQALATLRQKALSVYPDARLALLVNSKPGQQKSLLGTSLGDPSINEPTPGGKGRNWTLVAVSPAKKGASAFSMDGTTVDLVKAGAVTDDLLAQFGSPTSSALDLSKLDPATMKDSDTLSQAAGERGSGQQIGIALLAPDGLGVGPLPTPASGGASPQLAYELFSTDPAKQVFIFFDALTGKVVLDSGT